MGKEIIKSGDVPTPSDGEKEMSFIEHLEELRWHLIRSISAVVVFGIIAFIYQKPIFDKVVLGPKNKDFPTYRFFCNLSESTCFSPPEFKLITRELGEQFFVSLQVSFWLGLFAAFPYILYEFWKFIKPGLYKKERDVTRFIVLICSFLFILGISFGYFVLSPFAVSFLTNYSVSPDAQTSPTLASFVNYMVMFTFPSGILFELPVFVYFLSLLGIVTPETMRQYRKHALIVILIIASILTPPDITSQILVAIPVFLLYESSIIISKYAYKKYQKSLDDI